MLDALASVLRRGGGSAVGVVVVVVLAPVVAGVVLAVVRGWVSRGPVVVVGGEMRVECEGELCL